MKVCRHLCLRIWRRQEELRAFHHCKKGQIIERMLEEDAKEAEEAEKKRYSRGARQLILKMIMQHSTVEKRQKAYLR